MTPARRFITALVVAPLCAPLVMYLIIFLSSGPLRSLIVSGAPAYTDHFGSFEIVMVTGSIVAYLFAVLFGLPLYFLAKKLGHLTYWSLSIGSAAIGTVPFVLLGLTEGIEKMSEHGLVYAALALCGFIVGSVFYLIAEVKR